MNQTKQTNPNLSMLTELQLLLLLLVVQVILSCHSIEAASQKEQHEFENPSRIDNHLEDRADFSLLDKNDPIEFTTKCPFQDLDTSGDHDHDDDDWQIVDVPPGDLQFNHVDHLPITWDEPAIERPAILLADLIAGRQEKKKKEKNTYTLIGKQSPPISSDWEKRQQQQLEARKLFLERKFHHKSKLPGIVVDQQQQPQYQHRLIELRKQQPPPGGYSIQHEHYHQHQHPIITIFASMIPFHPLETDNELLDRQPQQLDDDSSPRQTISRIEDSKKPVATPPPPPPPVKTIVLEAATTTIAPIITATKTRVNSSSKNLVELNYGPQLAVNKSLPAAQRARESFQNAAEVARQLDLSNNANAAAAAAAAQLDNDINMIIESSSTKTNNNSNGEDQSANVWAKSAPIFGTGGDSMELASPKYLGFGEIFTSGGDPASSGGIKSRTQVRLSCSFDDRDDDLSAASNTTISNVEWAKFVGNYNPDEPEPSFECQFRSCRLIGLKNDQVTTIHPRPPIQRYSGNGQPMPSYSLTIHEVGQQHIGTYRCSALKQQISSNNQQKQQIVYKLIPLLMVGD